MLPFTHASTRRRRRTDPSAHVDGTSTPRRGLRGSAAATVVCLVAGLTVGLPPAVVHAASLPGLPWWYTQSPWYAYLPGAKLPTGGGSGTTPTPTLPGSSGVTGRSVSGTFMNASGALKYTVYVPSTYKAGTAVPLVVALHGCTQDADVFRQLTRWDQLAEAKKFIVVFPQQDQNSNQLKCWNFFQPAHMTRDQGEPALIAGLTKSIQSRYTIDAHRTFVNGLSAGGAMSSVMAATYPDLYAAAGIGSGCEYAATAACAGYKSADPVQAGQQAYQAMGSHARPMPVILFEGDQDTTVPPINAQQLVQQWQVTDDLADDGTTGSIPTAPTGVTHGQVPGGHAYTVTSYGDGHSGELLQSWMVSGMGHAWSGGCGCEKYADPAGPDETGAMYAFFMSHPLP